MEQCEIFSVRPIAYYFQSNINDGNNKAFLPSLQELAIWIIFYHLLHFESSSQKLATFISIYNLIPSLFLSVSLHSRSVKLFFLTPLSILYLAATQFKSFSNIISYGKLFKLHFNHNMALLSPGVQYCD